MLLSFRFANHRSFRDEQQLNLTPVYAEGLPDEHAPEAVTVAGIFGANASGKSNTLDALTYMRRLTLRSDREVEPGEGIRRSPFRLVPEIAHEPSRYVVDLLLDGVRHTYGFSIDDHQVLEEWLYCYPHNRQRKIFEREGSNFAWGEESGKNKELPRIAEITASAALFVSTVARFDLHKSGPQSNPAHAIYRWFRRIDASPGDRTVTAHRQIGWVQDARQRDLVVGLLRAADVGISDVVVMTPEADPAVLTRLSVVQAARAEISDIVVELANESLHEPSEQVGNLARQLGELSASQRRLELLVERERNPSPRLQFIHCGSDRRTTFDLADESAGTRQILALAARCVDALSIGGLMTVDEIDASLHPMLTAKMIGLFQSASTNPHRSQLLFTSHDATLLGTFDADEVLHRDQVWFTEKDHDGASTLFPLSEFKPRKQGENRQRRYLNGSYGAVPDLSKDLFEQALTARGEFGGAETE
jgi:hypothetical protein